MRDNDPRRALNKKGYSTEKEEGSKEVEYDHREQYVIARVEHVQDWFVIGFRLRRACAFSLKRKRML